MGRLIVLSCLPGVGKTSTAAARDEAELNLQLENDVVVDTVNDRKEARQTWRAAAKAGLLFVHLVLSDLLEHERRLAVAA